MGMVSFSRIWHHAILQKKVKKYFSDHSISVLDWPGNSPDLNPIENLWAIMKRRVKEHDCTTMTKLIEATVSVWYRDQEIKNMCEKLVISRPERIRQVIKSKGGHIINTIAELAVYRYNKVPKK